MNWASWNVSALKGQQAQIQILDQNTGGWGHINVDNIVFSDQAAQPRSVETAVDLLVNGNVVDSATGSNSESLDWASFDLGPYLGQQRADSDRRREHRRLRAHPRRPVHVRRRAGPVEHPAGALGRLRR